jgi:methionyl-tRNA formyltransferase
MSDPLDPPSPHAGGAMPAVVFLGAGAFGLPVLDMLAAAGRVGLVVSQPDRAAGRGKRPTPTPVAARAMELGLPLLRTDDCNTPAMRVAIREAAMAAAARAGADGVVQPGPAMVVIAFGQKLGPELLDGLFAVNLHGSLLPRWRGAAPVQRALMAGDDETGVSVIGLAQRMDAGVVHAMRSLRVGPMQTAGELHDALAALGPDAVRHVLEAWASGRANPAAQDESVATRAAKLSRADAWVDVTMDARAVRARINGLNPWPGCSATLDGHAVVLRRAVEAEEAIGADWPVGTVDAAGNVRCGRGVVRIVEVQAPGGKAMAFAEWARGVRLPARTTISSAAPVAT